MSANVALSEKKMSRPSIGSNAAGIGPVTQSVKLSQKNSFPTASELLAESFSRAKLTDELITSLYERLSPILDATEPPLSAPEATVQNWYPPFSCLIREVDDLSRNNNDRLSHLLGIITL